MSNSREYAGLARQAVITDRPETSHIPLFGVGANERILDIGSGQTMFRKLPGIVQLDYAYSDPAHLPAVPKHAVCALAQELPFANEKFDRVTCRWGNVAYSRAAAAAMAQEAIRVLKPGGQLQVFPAIFGGNRNFVRKLREEGFILDTAPGPWARRKWRYSLCSRSICYHQPYRSHIIC